MWRELEGRVKHKGVNRRLDGIDMPGGMVTYDLCSASRLGAQLDKALF